LRYAILGDVHANWEALTAVLKDAAAHDVQSFACTGDIVGYNADPAPCLQRLLEIGAVLVRGNHDHFCAHAFEPHDLSPNAEEAILWTRRKLNAEQIKRLGSLPFVKDIDGFTLVHNTLAPGVPWDYVLNLRDAEASMERQVLPVCFHGHTHVPVLFEQRDGVTASRYETLVLDPRSRYFINVGSVGQPRDRNPAAAYVLFDTTTRRVELRRVGYDTGKALDKIWRAGLPLWLGERLLLGV
jgi:diadenosine tetraphosphatase ApaH/serine/threonine PP2A family protein phosphatase